MSDAKPRTLFDKIWDSHVVEKLPDGTCILYIDRHLVHEVTSPQAFESLRLAGRQVPTSHNWQPEPAQNDACQRPSGRSSRLSSAAT